ncbi:hypothetical protein LSH36_625g00026 [Paralvinella palmiformis]|uniref:Uncharacterized protein n=1 Tax=Paralvinella palmiformis TaxID=53620 RepID=A0AAD9J3W6_9ANNE|nr:hypothetical protein LSH36_625g00026 [Paralvinella palmiformis]
MDDFSGRDLPPEDCLLEQDASQVEVYSWKDITAEFTDACEQLDLGELLHDSRFCPNQISYNSMVYY